MRDKTLGCFILLKIKQRQRKLDKNEEKHVFKRVEDAMRYYTQNSLENVDSGKAVGGS